MEDGIETNGDGVDGALGLHEPEGGSTAGGDA